jgi:N-acylglucosamine 2-epimerase
MPVTAPSADLAALRTDLLNHLTNDIVPFWTRHALDPEGGINTCIADDGTLISREKWLWSQWRAVWVFSKLHRGLKPSHSVWLDAAKQIASFALKYGWDESAGSWRSLVTAEGEVIGGSDSIYVDGFAIYGLVELALATGQESYLVWARKTADRVLARLEAPHDQIPHFPYPVPAGARVHGIPMMFALVLWELGQVCDDDRYRAAAFRLQNEVFEQFYRPEYDLVVERIAADGSLYPGSPGSAVVPGHVIEDMWFQIHIARERGDTARIAEACRLIRRHLEIGWDADPAYGGGILLAVDAKGGPEIGWKFADSKLWWPQTETLYALLLAYEHTRESWCLEWYDRVHRYAFAHYPSPHGEWTQRLKRDGSAMNEVVALPVKDPFHLPRALYYCVETLDRLIATPAGKPGAAQ